MTMLKKLKIFFSSGIFQNFTLCLIVALLIGNFADRRRAVSEINGHLEQFQMSRLMLNSRAQIQIILCNAALEGRSLKATQAGKECRVGIKSKNRTNRNGLISGVD